jgi:anti-anti-sigma factor
VPVRHTRPLTGHIDCTVTRKGDNLLVSFEGAVDFYTAATAKKVLLDLLDYEPAGMTIDTRDAFVDSSGIGVFVQVAQRARLERRDFRLLCDERLAPILRLHKLDDVLGISNVMLMPDVERSDRTRRIAA